MSARSEHAAVARENLEVADLRRDLEAQIAELLSGRAQNVSIDTDETAGRIAIVIDVEPSLFDAESEETEDVANSRSGYEQYLAANSDRLEDVGEVPAGATYWAWREARGGK